MISGLRGQDSRKSEAAKQCWVDEHGQDLDRLIVERSYMKRVRPKFRLARSKAVDGAAHLQICARADDAECSVFSGGPSVSEECADWLASTIPL